MDYLLRVLKYAYRLIAQRRLYYCARIDQRRVENFRILSGIFIGSPPKHSFTDITRHYQYAVYFDNEDPGAFRQIEKWFKYGFLSKDDCLIIFQSYRKHRKHLFSYLSDNGYSFVTVVDFDEFNFTYIDCVFYPFNSITNPYLIYHRSAKHVFIGHGDSEKYASINPMLKMYDHILVSGDRAEARLIKAGIVNQMDLGSKVLKIGMPYLPPATATKTPAVLYAPTWELSLIHI